MANVELKKSVLNRFNGQMTEFYNEGINNFCHPQKVEITLKNKNNFVLCTAEISSLEKFSVIYNKMVLT